VEKYGTARQATADSIIGLMCLACCITKATNTHSEYLITQACDQKTFLTRVAVSYAFFRPDNGKNSEKVPSRTIFAQISILDFGTQWITTGC